MKSFITATLLIGTIVIAKAQNNYNNNNYYYDNNNNCSNGYNNNGYYSNTNYSSNNSYGNTNYSYSSYNSGYNSNGWGYDYNYWTIRRIAKNYLFETGMFLNNVLYQFAPNPFTGPLLSNAVRHQRFAKTLYHQGFYDEALQHSNYARSLTMKAANFLNPYFMPDFTDFSFLNNGSCNNNYGGNYNNYNDGYRKSDPGSTNNTGGQGKTNPDAKKTEPLPINNSKGVKQIMKKEISASEIETLEKRLPKDNLQEKELLKTNSKDLTIE